MVGLLYRSRKYPTPFVILFLYKNQIRLNLSIATILELELVNPQSSISCVFILEDDLFYTLQALFPQNINWVSSGTHRYDPSAHYITPVRCSIFSLDRVQNSVSSLLGNELLKWMAAREQTWRATENKI